MLQHIHNVFLQLILEYVEDMWSKMKVEKANFKLRGKKWNTVENICKFDKINFFIALKQYQFTYGQFTTVISLEGKSDKWMASGWIMLFRSIFGSK